MKNRAYVARRAEEEFPHSQKLPCLRQFSSRLMIPAVTAALLFICPAAMAGPYLSSAHGNSTLGVKRNSAELTDYSTGNCDHCHEQHASIDGQEPAPVNGVASPYALFAPTNSTSQTDNFCFNCHGNVPNYQNGGSVINRSYSYRAGGWTSDTIDDIAESFASASAHDLRDISVFIDGKWGYSDKSNPCVACHNPHAAQGDPAGNGNTAKTSATRGYPLSRPSLHASNPSALWGDGAGEKMSDYASSPKYQAPLRYGSTTTYEPDGSTTQDGTNLTDSVTFCTDCHNLTNTIWSTSLSRNLKKFDWAAEKHGGGSAGDRGGGADVITPYADAKLGQYVLACTDCHEGHGSSNQFLVRKAVNKVGVTIPGGRGKWEPLCDSCHTASTGAFHHSAPGLDCAIQCHYSVWVPPGVSTTEYRECIVCHFHGSTVVYNGTTGSYQTYNGGEYLF
ncbi:MAG: cytochrome c3 family protein [Pseudomonadota bacterium]